MNAVQEKETMQTLVYPISLKYGQKDWNIYAALRELLSNALDTKVNYSITYKDGKAVIQDEGNGLPEKAFVFGESERDESQIGQFGEGLKMAFITCLREKRKVWVETVGFDVRILVSDSFGTQVMKLEFEPNKKVKGTTIYVECTEEELTRAKELFLELSSLKKVDQNIFLPSGKIFIVGLETTQLPNMLFSYNIPDKTMTNRDRNIVDTTKLMDNLVKILKEAKNQKFIKGYLTSFKDNPNAYEYQLAFQIPRTKLDVWKKVCEKEFPKACLSSDLKSDLYANAMGYTILRNIPYNLLQVFKQLGLKDSAVHASSYKGEALKAKNKLIYPIGEDYVKDWTRLDAIRELISNALDAGDPRITHNGKEARISDSGEGILKKHFVLGVSEKETNSIGKFGEGMKIAALVLARTGTPVTIESVGWTYECKLEHQEEFNMKLFVVEYKKNARKKGTSIVFDCKESELEQTKQRFIQFQGIRKKPVSSGNENLDVYLEQDQQGQLYIQGVKTTTVRSLFGYNVKDKNVLNGRDRNNYNHSIFTSHIARLLEQTQHEELISTFLSSWQTKGTNFIEYDINFVPRTQTMWNKVAKKMFPKACFSNEPESDFIAKCAGYTILKNVPYAVKSILQKIGITYSHTVASRYKNKGILFDNRIVYPITSDYGRDWTIIRALKELVANALDADGKCTVTYKDGEMLVQDKGEGLSKHNLLFGSTTKSKKDDNIGLFGEGLKMASLVLARNNRKFKLITKGFEYTAKIERDRAFNADVLVIELSPSRKKSGTIIHIETTQNEYEKTKNMFLAFNKSYVEVAPGIYTTDKHSNKGLFLNGVWVSSLDTLFSYNLTNKNLIGRDRSQVDHDSLRLELGKVWSKCGEKKAIEQLLSSMNNSHIESNIRITPTASVKSIWEAVVKKLYGKSCFSIGSEHDQVAKDRGFNLLLQNNPGLTHILMNCGVKTSDRVVTLRGDEKIVKKRFDEKDLSVAGKRRWNKAKKTFTELYGVNLAKRLEIIDFEDDYRTLSDGTRTLGLYNSATDTIYISKSLIEENDVEKLLGTLIHEQMHRKTGAHDCTREFEWGLSMELGRLANMLFKK